MFFFSFFLLTTMHTVHTANIPVTRYQISRCMTFGPFVPERKETS